MATPLSAAKVLAALRAEGVRVVEVGNWRTHNRNHKGAWGGVNGSIVHHTVTKGTAPTVSLCRTGHSTLPGPLCHGVIAKDGQVHMVGWGRANHAGGGDPGVLEQVTAESYGSRPSKPTRGNSNGVDGNAHFYGWECENLGDGRDPWPAAQYDAIVRTQAALCRAHGWSAKSVIGHLEWSSDKIDPRGFTMPDLRADVAERLKHPASWSPSGATPEPTTPPQTTPTAPVEDPMPAPALIFESVPGGPDLLAGEWLELPAAEDTAILRGPCTYSVTYAATLTGTEAADRVQLRFVHVDIETRRRSAALPVDVPVRAGDVGVQITRAGGLPAGQYLKVEALADSNGARITHRTVDSLVWR